MSLILNSLSLRKFLNNEIDENITYNKILFFLLRQSLKMVYMLSSNKESYNKSNKYYILNQILEENFNDHKYSLINILIRSVTQYIKGENISQLIMPDIVYELFKFIRLLIQAKSITRLYDKLNKLLLFMLTLIFPLISEYFSEISITSNSLFNLLLLTVITSTEVIITSKLEQQEAII